jgi:hypothetical protein
LSSDSLTSSDGSGSSARPATIQRLIVVAYILAFAMPPLGFGIGLALLLWPGVRSRHGVWIALVSVVAAGIWALLISSGALTTTNQGY